MSAISGVTTAKMIVSNQFRYSMPASRNITLAPSCRMILATSVTVSRNWEAE